LVNAYERNPAARLACVKHYGYSCTACGVTLADVYGDIGRNFIHVHHLKQLSQVGESYEVNPIDDLCPVCPNCHALIHRRTPPYTVEEIAQIIRSKKPRTTA
jgi:predicted HNH restriction endonuclease